MEEASSDVGVWKRPVQKKKKVRKCNLQYGNRCEFCVPSLLLDIHCLRIHIVFAYKRIQHAGLLKKKNAAQWNVKNYESGESE